MILDAVLVVGGKGGNASELVDVGGGALLEEAVDVMPAGHVEIVGILEAEAGGAVGDGLGAFAAL